MGEGALINTPTSHSISENINLPKFCLDMSISANHKQSESKNNLKIKQDTKAIKFGKNTNN